MTLYFEVILFSGYCFDSLRIVVSTLSFPLATVFTTVLNFEFLCVTLV